MVFKAKKLVIFGNLILFLFLLSITTWTVITYGRLEGSFFPNLIFILVTLLSGFISVSSMRSKILILRDRIEVHVAPFLIKAFYNEIDRVVEDNELAGRYFVVTKGGKKIPISSLWFENVPQILALLRENLTTTQKP